MDKLVDRRPRNPNAMQLQEFPDMVQGTSEHSLCCIRAVPSTCCYWQAPNLKKLGVGQLQRSFLLQLPSCRHTQHFIVVDMTTR
jgi:hypothetical protein